ncbi:helix-turn-helix domain-containing protein [Croceicoccus hydrothermalis]|uniref:helix-turn-helix domain-containing protein n=1 Tax=Croceicoccus hydrothermalis TaxID=2867964 RepID=UPI001EFB4F16|nr:winged helix-turn-helix domain-containing protein [Croceicoccus hydrothermalis]
MDIPLLCGYTTLHRGYFSYGVSNPVIVILECVLHQEEATMGRAIGLREDFDGPLLQRVTRRSKSSPQARRLLTVALIYDVGSRSESVRIGGVTLQIIRDWVIGFNTCDPDGLLDGKAVANALILDDMQRRALLESGEGALPAIHGVVRWRLIDLAHWLHGEFAVSLDKTTVNRALKKFGYVKLTARPGHQRRTR